MRGGEKEPALASTTVDDFVIDITGRIELVESSVGQSVGGLGELLSTEELPKKPFALAAYITGASVECNSKPMCFKNCTLTTCTGKEKKNLTPHTRPPVLHVRTRTYV